jgi:hypothetical protein
MGHYVFFSKCLKCCKSIVRFKNNTYTKCICEKTKENAIDYAIECLTDRKKMFLNQEQTSILEAKIQEINTCLICLEVGKEIEEGKSKRIYAKI